MLTGMSIPLPDLDLTDARIARYHYTVARKSIPAFCNLWIHLADQTLVQLRFAEVRGLHDLGFTKGPLTGLEEAAKSKFATDLANPPVFAGNRPGRPTPWWSRKRYLGHDV